MKVYVAIEVTFDYYRDEEFMGVFTLEESALDSFTRVLPVVLVEHDTYLSGDYPNLCNSNSNDHNLIIIKEFK